MKHMIRLAVVAMLGIGLAACSLQSIENAWTTVSGATVSYKVALTSVAGFNALQDTGAAYLRLPTCTTTSGPICHDRHATAPMKAAFLTGRRARDDVLTYMKTNPCDAAGNCPVMPNGVLAGLQGAINELNTLYATYKVAQGG